jgi:hypothetical protein
VPDKSPRKRVVEVVIPIRRKSGDIKPTVERDDESEEDDLGWEGERNVDEDGDWEMGSGRGAPSPGGRGRTLTGSILTGEKDSRSELLPWIPDTSS